MKLPETRTRVSSLWKFPVVKFHPQSGRHQECHALPYSSTPFQTIVYNPRYVSWPVHLSAARLTAAVCTTSYEHCVFGNFCHCYNSQLTSQFYDILQQTARVCFHVAIAFEYFVRRNNKTRKICLRQNIVRLNILIVFLCDSLKK